MTVKDLREIMIHFQDRKYDNYKISLWDFQNQRKLHWNLSYGLSHPDKELSFPVTVEPVDGVQIEERLKKIVADYMRTRKVDKVEFLGESLDNEE